MHFTLNSPVCGLRLCSIAIGLGSLAHLVRLFLGFQIMIGSHAVPVWLSGVAFVVLGALSFWLWKLSMPSVAPTVPPSPPAKTAIP